MSRIRSIIDGIAAVFFPPIRRKANLPPDLSGARLSYSSDGRSGEVIFSRGLNSFRMYYEFGGGDALAILSVPTTERWRRETGLPLEQRDAVLKFVAEQVVADQTASGQNRYRIDEDSITIFTGPRDRSPRSEAG